ncbi:cation:proton antiporter domain-containing protein [Haloarchaeobius sp. TZWSO28]|uniref:cation:proton antiporter domain-containing protein n=1 Tax=Haloarchaeobius sp. TZWSO28 TaxID=3446119 RepID=UPI003EB8846D
MTELLTVVVAVVGLGVAAQVIADRLRMPSVPLLVLVGLLLGPEGVGLVKPATFGDALSVIVGISVAIIVFEGAFNLKSKTFKRAPSATITLITVGVLISFLGTAVAVRFFLDATWGVSLLVGALLVATGPTVITPILSVVRVRPRVAATLEVESIINDVTAAILAVATFEALTAENPTLANVTMAFGHRLLVGALVGVVVAGFLWYLFEQVEHSPWNAPQNARLLVLASAVVAHGTAELVVGEAGIAAAATAGVVLGNANLAYEANIASFKDDVTVLLLSFVFIILTTLVDFDELLVLGMGGVLVVAVVLLVVRPLSVFVSTWGSTFDVPDRLFMSFVAPRGIVPASVATLFALELREFDPTGASILVGTVFLVIITSVVVEGGLARSLADLFEVTPPRVLIVGGGAVGRAMARQYDAGGERIELVDRDSSAVETGRNAGFTVHRGDATDPAVLRAAGAADADRAVVATGDDRTNVHITRLLRKRFDVDPVFVRADDPDAVETVKALGGRPLAGSVLHLWAIEGITPRETTARPGWLTALLREGDIRQFVVDTSIAGLTVGAVAADLPERAFLVTLTRGDETTVPDAEERLEHGDRITFVGAKPAVREALERLTDPRDR